MMARYLRVEASKMNANHMLSQDNVSVLSATLYRVRHSNFVPNTHLFKYSTCKVYSDLETRVTGHSRSSATTWIDWPPMISY